jgi:acetylornithine deacetylase
MSSTDISSPDTLTSRALAHLGRLVAFDTTSRNSNLELLDYAEQVLAGCGACTERVFDDSGKKANLWALMGPEVEGGVILSGHTDVVPVDGQPWTSDPWTLTDKGDGRLYGRGAADMKGFLALALALAPDLVAAPLKRPVHFAFSYDEEVGCLGAPRLIERLAALSPRPALAVIGEPTSMQLVLAHKGILAFRIAVRGREAHSSQTHLGVSAVMEAVPLMGELRALAERLAAGADPASPFEPKGPTLTIGVIHGGTAGNILARECVFQCDLRVPPGSADPLQVLAPVFDQVRALDARLKARFGDCGASVEILSQVPPLAPEPDGQAARLIRRLTGDNGPGTVVSYGAEAGQFQQAGFSAAICGPGSIDQAHQADEYIEIAQMERGAAFMKRLAEALSTD